MYYIQSIPKRRHIKFSRQGIIQKKEYKYYIVRRQVGLPAVFTLKLEGNISPMRVTGMPLGSPVVGLPPFSLLTGVFCSISSADDRTLEGRFTHSMPCPCRAHAVVLPCLAANGLECVFPI